jgi:hypothetical protein
MPKYSVSKRKLESKDDWEKSKLKNLERLLSEMKKYNVDTDTQLELKIVELKKSVLNRQYTSKRKELKQLLALADNYEASKEREILLTEKIQKCTASTLSLHDRLALLN